VSRMNFPLKILRVTDNYIIFAANYKQDT